MVKKEKEHAENLEELFQEAVSLHHNNELDKACQLYQRILRSIPESPLVNYNLGLALFELKKYCESYTCYSVALKSAPEEHDLLYNFALCAKKLGKFEEAVDAYGTILEQDPEDKDTLYNLGCCLVDLGVDSKAIPLFLRVLDITSDHTSSLNNIACIYHRNGQYSEAKKYYTRLLEIEPDHKIARHLLASVQGDKSKSPPDQYIEKIFDNYSSRYEDNMVTDLEYTVPHTLRNIFNQCANPQQKSLKTLDLGCGTGLCGEAFYEVCSTLAGVDLSSNMIEKAAQKKIYTSLYVDEILRYISSCDQIYDLILAADVLIYLGDLEPIFKKLTQIALPGTYFCFSTEKCTNKEFILRRTGRFAHGHEYLSKVCSQTGWEILKAEPAKLRKERFNWIEGMIYIVARTR
jgi:predicted TPR repeat methyltransferase